MLRYFIPDKKIGIEMVSPALWAELGLSHAATQWPVLNVLQAAGPSGTIGTVVVFHDADKPAGRAECGYFPEKQDWVKCAGGKYWCGKTKGETIEPEVLRREDGAPGIRVRLGDGNEWEIARAVQPNGRKSLTRKIVINEDGTVAKGAVVDRFAEFDREAEKFFYEWMASVEGERPMEYMLPDLMALASLALQTNYRIGRDEAVNLLGLFDEENMWQTCLAAVSVPTILAMADADADAQKKTDEPDTPSG